MEIDHPGSLTDEVFLWCSNVGKFITGIDVEIDGADWMVGGYTML